MLYYVHFENTAAGSLKFTMPFGEIDKTFVKILSKFQLADIMITFVSLMVHMHCQFPFLLLLSLLTVIWEY